MSVVDQKEHHDQIVRYADMQPAYQDYRAALEKILKGAVKDLAPEGIVQARVKTISSFAEKVVRKRDEYTDPVSQMTDLCGVRVITLTVAEVKKVCDFIRKNFDIDEEHSVDKRLDLGPSRFGYSSIHFIVKLPDRPTLCGVTLPEAAVDRELKAEIQVRTLLEHVWAAISHDSAYKNRFTAPDEWQRHLNRLAALLEEADGQFDRLLEELRIFDSVRGALLTEKELEHEVGTLQTILACEPEESRRPDVALELARLHSASGDWSRVIEVLAEFEDRDRFEVWRDLGYAYGRLWEENPDQSQHLIRSQRLLEKALKDRQDRKKDDAQTRAYLGWYWEANNKRRKARDHYARAYELEPQNPYYFCTFLEFELERMSAALNLDLLGPSLAKAIESCRSHADVKFEILHAYFTMAKLHLLLKEPYPALAAGAKGIDVRLWGKLNLPPRVLAKELESVDRLESLAEKVIGFEWLRSLLRLAAAVSGRHKAALSQIKAESRIKYDPDRPVLIVAGSCQDNQAAFNARYRNLLADGLTGFEGPVISGGTISGVCGLIGTMAAEFTARGQRDWSTHGYLPADKGDHDPGYDHLVQTDGQDFSPLEPLQMWIDLIASKVKPDQVRLLGIGGGPISAFEYRLALALGAEVGVVRGSGGAVLDLEKDRDWKDHKRLFVIPPDPWIVAAFINPGRWEGDPDVLDEAAQKSHEKSIPHRKQQYEDQSIRKWQEMLPQLKKSVEDRLAGASIILRRVGYGVRPLSTPPAPEVNFTPEELKRMAKLEHGRWVMERLRSQWTLGPRDVENKITPFLVEWGKLPKQEQAKDFKYVARYPQDLKEGGLEVYRLDDPE